MQWAFARGKHTPTYIKLRHNIIGRQNFQYFHNKQVKLKKIQPVSNKDTFKSHRKAINAISFTWMTYFLENHFIKRYDFDEVFMGPI